MIDYGSALKRVQKCSARKLFDAGVSIYMIPCKFSPDRDEWGIGCWVDNKHTERTFDEIYDAFTYYNCHQYSTGRYPSFYVKREE